MPPKAKADNTALRELKHAVRDGQLKNLYVFHGEEAYLREYYLGQLKKALLPAGLEEFNLHTAQGKECSPEWLEQAVDCLPMMGERTVVLVTDFDLSKTGEKDREDYIRIFSQLPEYCCVVLVYDLIPYKLDARTKLASAIKEHGTVVNFASGSTAVWRRSLSFCAAI